MKIIFATNNQHKLQEVKQKIARPEINIISLKEAGIDAEIPEDFDTLEDNALQKARFVSQKVPLNVFSDDTGLEVEALNGAPGVYSARYAGEHCSFEDNINKLLQELKGIKNRKAHFRTVIALIYEGQEYIFQGIIKGHITEKPKGKGGFGYDPIFIPEGYDRSFSEMSAEEKNKISHRAKAVDNLVDFLQQKIKKSRKNGC